MKRTLTPLLFSAALLMAATAAKADFDEKAAQDFVTAFDARIQGQQSLNMAAPPIERIQKPGLLNVAHVEKGIYRGSRPRLDQGGMQSLQELGIKTIVNLQGGDLTSPKMSRMPGWSAIVLKGEPGESLDMIAQETSTAHKDGIADVHVALDSLDPVTDAEAVDIDRVLKMMAASSPDTPIYIHCEHGKDRTGLVLGLYRMRYDGWSLEKAAAEMKAMGHTGILDELFTGNMDLDRVLARFPNLAVAP